MVCKVSDTLWQACRVECVEKQLEAVPFPQRVDLRDDLDRFIWIESPNSSDGGTRLINISFHSPSVEPGHTPYVRDTEDLKRFYAWFDGVFGFLAKAGVEPASTDEVLAAAEAAR